LTDARGIINDQKAHFALVVQQLSEQRNHAHARATVYRATIRQFLEWVITVTSSEGIGYRVEDDLNDMVNGITQRYFQMNFTDLEHHMGTQPNKEKQIHIRYQLDAMYVGMSPGLYCFS
jgi:hypothetical protein